MANLEQDPDMNLPFSMRSLPEVAGALQEILGQKLVA